MIRRLCDRPPGVPIIATGLPETVNGCGTVTPVTAAYPPRARLNAGMRCPSLHLLTGQARSCAIILLCSRRNRTCSSD